ncbi:MAG: hypothetical protein ACTSVO_03700 [Candidatus Heimdallarchaeaceae archaeon]
MSKNIKYDIIMYDDYKEEVFKIITDAKITSLFNDSRYDPIFQGLRDGPLTVKDILLKYNEIVFENVDKMDLAKSEKIDLRNKMYRQEKTLYKYLNKLESSGIIVPAGKRFLRGRTAAETLYGRTAKLFFFDDESKKFELLNELKLALPIVAKVLTLKTNKELISTKCLFKLIELIFTRLEEDRKELMEKYSADLVNMNEEINYNNLRSAIKLLDYFFVILNNDEFEKELLKCFIK